MGNGIKYWKKIGVALCCVILLVGIIPVPVLAAKSFNQTKKVTITEQKDYIHTQKYTWIKYKAPGNGYITVTAKKAKNAPSVEEGENAQDENASLATGMLRLYDSKKKTLLSSECQYNTAGAAEANAMTYGVKKNATYYFRVEAQGAVTLNCKFKKVNDKSGSTKAKARQIQKNQLVKGILAAGDQTADWYKITIGQKQVLHLFYAGNVNNQIQFTFSGDYLNTAVRYVTQGNTNENYTYSLERLQPGTYYVKVENCNKQSSGYYTLRWQ